MCGIPLQPWLCVDMASGLVWRNASTQSVRKSVMPQQAIMSVGFVACKRRPVPKVCREESTLKSLASVRIATGAWSVSDSKRDLCKDRSDLPSKMALYAIGEKDSRGCGVCVQCGVRSLMRALSGRSRRSLCLRGIESIEQRSLESLADRDYFHWVSVEWESIEQCRL